MSRLDALRHRLHVLLNPRVYEREVAEELEFHLDLEAMQQSHAAHGAMSAADAKFAARRQLGNVTYYREETRRTAGLALLDDLRNDVRYALRSFRRTPTFTAVAVLTLAIGIGANTAIFSAVHALLLRPLPFAEPERLMSVALTDPSRPSAPGRNELPWSYPKFEVLRTTQRVYSHVSLWFDGAFTVRHQSESYRAWAEAVDASYLPALGVRPALGRNFTADEARPDGPRVVMLSDNVWRLAFDADSGVIGRTFDVESSPYTVVGVLPRGFRGLSGRALFWMPALTLPATWPVKWATEPWSHNFRAVGRLAPGVSPEHAAAVVRQIGTTIDVTFPDPRNSTERWSAVARELDQLRVDGRVRRTLFILFGAVGLVLMIACANVANLFLVRASARRREIAVRLAIGAGRVRLVRQLVVESVVLSFLGGLASVVFAWWGAKMLASLELAELLRLQNVGGLGAVNSNTIALDLNAFMFTAVVAMGTGVVFGLVPALQATRFSVTDALKDDIPFFGGRRGRLTSRNALVVAEIALAVVLLAGSGLMMRSLAHLLEVRPGFDETNVLTMRVNRSPAWSRDSIERFYDVAMTRLAALPGITEVAIGDCPPLDPGCFGQTAIALHDRPPAPEHERLDVGVHWITPGWPTVMRVPLVRGRLLTAADRSDSPTVVLVNEAAARAFWPGKDPIGQRVGLQVDHIAHDTATVVGVVGDVRYGRLELEAPPDVYVSYYQSPISFRMMFFMRTRGDPDGVIRSARAALREVAPGFPVYDVASLETRLTGSLANTRFSAMLLGLFAALALLLSMVGTYGVISFGVAQRTREIGVRVALGATRRDVVRLVVGQGISLAAAGIVIGLLVAVATTGVLRSLLFGVEPTDPATFAAIVAMLILAVLTASWLPAQRAAGVPAVQALRSR